MRDHLRAVLLALVVGVNGLAALQLPARITDKDLQNPVVRDELTMWTDLIVGVGVPLSEDQLLQGVRLVSQTPHAIRKPILAPFRPLYRITWSWQGWGLFDTPDSRPHILRVEGRRDADWFILYDSANPDQRWMGATLHYRRVRALYAPGNRKPRHWEPFVDWLAGVAFEDFPDLEEVRVTALRTHTTLPGEEPDLNRKPRFVRSVLRGEDTR
ncbi:MAG: hypothetical protein AAFV53_22015 [Myxococcota bacterium]